MKKIISAILTAIMLLSAIPVMAGSNDENVMALLSELNIMVGDENGNYRLDDNVSRAEFAKIAINASRAKNTVASGLKVSPFRDVTYQHWSAPYIKAAVSAGIVEGYIDGTFRPDNTVSYEEALTMMLKVLGYTNDDFGVSWPYGQMGLAANIEITKNVNAKQGEALTRGQVANLVYNTLDAKFKDSQTKLISVFDCEVKEDVTIIASHNEDSSLAEDKIFTTAGTFEIDDKFDFSNVGKKGDIYVKNGDDFVAFAPSNSDNSTFDKYIIYSKLANAVVGYKNGSFTQIDITDGTTCYKESMKTNYASVKNSLEMGDIIYVRKDGNSIDYVTYDEGNMEGPVKVTDTAWVSRFEMDDSTTVMRNGVKVSASDIQMNDIIYYCKDLNMVLAYIDKVTGVYEKASPTKDSPTSVTISGKEYTVEGVEAFNDLSSSGSFKFGDTITVLLGRTGQVAGVVGGSASSVGSKYGFVTETGIKDYTNTDGSVYSSYYAKVVTPDGVVNEYATRTDYKTFKCYVVSVSFKDGVASLSRVSDGSSGLSGRVNAQANKIGDYDMADNIQILDTVGKYSDDTPLYSKVYPQRINGITLNSANVAFYSRNAFGEIDQLILKDVTGDAYDYGIIIRSDNTTRSYTVDINGVQNTYKTSFTSSATGPHRLIMTSTIESMRQLTACTSSISKLSRTEATVGNQTFLLSDKVVVYLKKDSTTYMKITLDDAINGDYKLTGYYDKAQTAGGRIRIIIAQ